MNTKAKVVGRLTAQQIADGLSDLCGDFYTKADFGLLDRGVERWTYCAIVMLLAQMLENNGLNRLEPFLEACRYYEVADHECMKDFPYCTERQAE